MVEKLNLYPEMNREIVKILRLPPQDDSVRQYAARLIEEQAAQIAAMQPSYDVLFAIGETVYYYNKYARKRAHRIKEYTIQSVEFFKDSYVLHLARTIKVYEREVMSVLFRTREEAESALAESERGTEK